MASENKITNGKEVIVSIIVPCYNQGQYLSECLGSVISQTYSKWECIIVNDGSKDDTEEISIKWLEKDARFRYFKKENGGLPSARNFGIAKSNGHYILPLDADDYISDNYLQGCVEALENQKCKLVYGKVMQFGVRNGHWDLGEYSYLDLLAYNMIHCCAMYQKSDWEAIGGYDEIMSDGLEDWEFWIRLLENNAHVKLLKSITFHYRIKDVSMITLMDKTSFKNAREYVFKKHSGLYMEKLYEMVREKRRLDKLLVDKKFLFKKFLKSILSNYN